MAIELLATDVIDSYATNFVLDDAVRNNPAAAVEAFVFWRYADEPTAEPQPLGTATIGQQFKIPFDFSDGREIELFAVPRTATKEQLAVNILNGISTFFLPNLENLTPSIAQTAGTTASNTSANVTVSNFTNKSLHRRIKVSPNSDMSSAVVSTQKASDFGGVLPTTIDITKASSSGAEHRYVTVEHSSNETDWGTASNILDITFADSGGSGGGGGATAPEFLSGSWDGTENDLSWTAGSGSGNYTLQSRYRIYNTHTERWSSWTSYSTVSSSISATSYSDTQAADTFDVEFQYRVKRTSESDTYYSLPVTIPIAGTG